MKRPEITNRISAVMRQMMPSAEVYLFGSEARGDARPDSDIDLLVLLDKDVIKRKETDEVFDILLPIELDTMICINPIIRSRKQWETQIMTPLKYNIQREGIKLQ